MNRFFLTPAALALAACSPVAPVVTDPAPVTAATPAPAPAPLPLLGVLEDRPGATTTEQARFAVRMLFQKEGAAWKSLAPACSDKACLGAAPAKLPPNAAWNIVHAGQPKGSVHVVTPAAWQLYADVGMQDLTNPSVVQTVGERTQEFAADGGTPVYRPLVAVTVTAVADPDAWAAGKLAPQALTAVQGAFRKQFVEVVNCPKAGSMEARPESYKDSDIATSGVSVSSKGWTVLTANLQGYRCDGPFEETAYAPQTFAVSANGATKYLGESLKLVDTGDFDGDGQSELLFAIQDRKSVV